MFGLICCSTHESFHLNSISVECNIRNLLATCSTDFVYENKSDSDGEGLFSFPLEGTCVVYHFEAEIDKRKISGVCKEKHEAMNMYTAAVESGHRAAIVERNTDMHDVFRLRIGNFPKNSEARIKLKFALEMSLDVVQKDKDADTFGLSLPLILRPRYMPTNFSGDAEVFHVSNRYDYKFKANIAGTKVIRNVYSPSYSLDVKFCDHVRKTAEVCLISAYEGEHDLEIFIDYLQMKEPSVLYEYGCVADGFKGEKVTDSFLQPDVAMLNFIMKTDSIVHGKMEIVIIVDRSGSMQGSRIDQAKQCLLIFIKSLPTDCRFQIYGFGSRFDKAFSTPALYDKASLETALTYQKNLDANFGGTEILAPLTDMYSYKLPPDYGRIVFFLTDGDFYNQSEVANLVKVNSDKTRLFSVGIGDGCSTSLLKMISNAGNGKAAFVRSENVNLSATVIGLLDIALNSPACANLKVQLECPENVSAVVVPNTIPSILYGHFVTVFCMISGRKSGVEIKCNLSGMLNDQNFSHSLIINEENAITDSEYRVHRLMAKYKLAEITEFSMDIPPDVKKSAIDLSIEANIVSDFTSFVAIESSPSTDPSNNIIIQENQEVMKNLINNPVSLWASLQADSALFDACADQKSDFRCKSVKRKCKGGFFALPSLSLPKFSFPHLKKKDVGRRKSSGSSKIEKEKEKKEIIEAEKINKQSVNVDIVTFLAEKQDISGYWVSKKDTAKTIGLDFGLIINKKPDSVEENLWFTIVVYQFLTIKMKSREKEWRLYGKKAKDWISKNLLNHQIMNELLQTAADLFS